MVERPLVVCDRRRRAGALAGGRGERAVRDVAEHCWWWSWASGSGASAVDLWNEMRGGRKSDKTSAPAPSVWPASARPASTLLGTARPLIRLDEPTIEGSGTTQLGKRPCGNLTRALFVFTRIASRRAWPRVSLFSLPRSHGQPAERRQDRDCEQRLHRFACFTPQRYKNYMRQTPTFRALEPPRDGAARVATHHAQQKVLRL